MAFITRKPDAHKGDHGSLAVLGGAQGTVGAAFLAARTALMSGSGRVFVVRPNVSDGLILDALHPEIMVIDYAQARQKPITVWAAGPGLGMSDAAHQMLAETLNAPRPLVIDADALNLMAEDPALGRQCSRRTAGTILTPHPGEAARLLDCRTEDIQAHRDKSAQQLAHRFNAIVVLKGAQTIICDTTTSVVNASGNPGLASGGTGDVLTGLIGSLCAQGLRLWQAALLAVRIHGQAADRLTDQLGGPIGLTASELIPEIRRLLNHEQPVS